MAKQPRVLIISCMKNEGAFILEWVAHNLAVGVTDFLIYTNDCEDGTDAIWQRLEALGVGQQRENTILRRGVQKSALLHALDEPVVAQTDWTLVLDVDEFVNIKVGDGTLSDLWTACPEATSFAMTWRIFGDGGRIGFVDAPLTDQFTLAAPQFIPSPPQAWGVKTLYKNNGLFGRMGVHVPLDPDEARRAEIVTVNGSGAPLPDSHKTGKWRSDRSTYGYDLVQLNHYAVRSVESFLIKRDRGRVNHMNHDQGFEYWEMMSHNAVVDDTIGRRRAATQKVYDDLLADAELAALHARAVDWHKAKIAALKNRPDFAVLFDTIVDRIATRPTPKEAA